MQEKLQRTQGGSDLSSEGSGLFESLGSVKAEVAKIHWTSIEELKSYVRLVLLSTFAMGMIIYCMDLLLGGALQGVSSLAKLLTH